MKDNFYYNNDICIVGIGCVLPEANNIKEFWGNISSGHCSIKEMPEKRFKKHLYFSNDKNEKDKSYSNIAAFIDDNRLKKICKNNGLNFNENNRLQIMSFEATRQALNCLNSDSLEKIKNNTPIFLGCMDIDEGLVLEKFFIDKKNDFKKYIKKNKLENAGKILKSIKNHFLREKNEDAIIASVLAISAINSVKKGFDIGGEGVIFDAACASSMAAFDAAIKKLKNYESDYVISGGIESNLGSETFVLFSKVGALSKGVCLPFDKKTDGLSQGEGAVIFILQRLEDALRDKNKIYGVIKAIGGSSDGKKSSLFSPSLEGQILAYERAYSELDKDSVDYIECHGTGTKIGDSMEIKSLNGFFKNNINEKIPIGSVKSLIGHIKGAAGAAGILKCVLMMKNKTIIPSKYIKQSICDKSDVVFINKKSISLDHEYKKPLRFGVSSFGFGNINYHLVIDEYDDNLEIKKTYEKQSAINDAIVVIGDGSASCDKINYELLKTKFMISQETAFVSDKVQLTALMAVFNAFKNSNIEIDYLDKKNVSVISAFSLDLDTALDFSNRIKCFEFFDALDFLDKKSLDIILNFKNKFPEVNEDTGPGILNNVIAGRICHTFDFNGKNFNIDSDFNSFPAALSVAVKELKENGGIIVLIFGDEKLSKNKMRIERKNVSCLLLSTLLLAKEKKYPIQKIVKKIKYYD